MEIDVAFHKWHVVAGPVGGTVTSVDGSKTFCTIPEGGQGTFYATVTKVVTSDDSITVDEVVNFNSAPVKLKLLGLLGGGASTLPSGYLQTEFLESTGTQYIHTGILNTSEIGAQCESTQTQNKYNLNPLGARNMYLGCRLFTPFVYQADVWGIGYNDFLRATHTTDGFVGRKYKASTNFKNNGLAELDGTTLLELPDVDFEGTAIISLFGCEVEDGYVSNRFEGRIFNAKLTQGVGFVRDFVPVLDKNGIPCMFDKVTKQPFYNSGTGSFIVGMTMKQARKLGNLPKTGGELTVSLPWEAQLVQHNGQVEQALETARGKGWLLKVQYREPEADSAVYNKYAACKNAADMAAVNADYMTDVTNDGEWNYPLPGLTNASNLFMNCKDTRVKKIKIVAEAATGAISYLAQGSNIEEADITTPLATTAAGVFYGASVKKIRLVAPKCTQFVDFCTSAKLTDFEGDISSARNIACRNAKLNKTSILWLCSQMAEYTGTSHSAYGGQFEVGIHVDYKNDEEVLAAVASVEEKNYVVVLNWNGTPTASASVTYGLRKPLIYAKLSEREDKRVLSYGHYVTNWQENGYMEFASVEEAEEYFGIEKGDTQ